MSSVCLSFIYELLERAHLNYSSKTAVYEALEQITGYLAGRQCGCISSYFCLYNNTWHDLGSVTVSAVHSVMSLFSLHTHI